MLSSLNGVRNARSVSCGLFNSAKTITTQAMANPCAETTCSFARRYFTVVIVCGVIMSNALPAHALLNTWTNPVTGSWSDASKWTGGVPTSTDSATFDKAGTYTVNFSNVFQNLTDIFVSAGNVTFERVTSPATLSITTAGYEDKLTIGGGTLNLGLTLPVNITVASHTNINSGGALNVNVGSALNTGSDLNINSSGALAVSSGGDVVSYGGYIGSVIGTSAAATVTGAGSTWGMISARNRRRKCRRWHVDHLGWRGGDRNQRFDWEPSRHDWHGHRQWDWIELEHRWIANGWLLWHGDAAD